MNESDALDLPEDMRCALHSLHADMDYLIARIRVAEVEEMGMLRQSIFERLSHVEEAAYRLNAAAQQLTAAEARNAALVEALTPFAEFDTEDFPDEMRAFDDDPRLTIGHFRAARAALAQGDK